MKILFVCSGNIFRSFSAETLTKKYIEDNNIQNITVSSAGTNIGPDPAYPQTLKRLKYYTASTTHKKRQISNEICKENDLIICMAKWHQEYVKNIGFDSVLFNEIAYNKKENLLDEAEYGEKFGWNYDLTGYIYKTIDYIHEAIPKIVSKLQTNNS